MSKPIITPFNTFKFMIDLCASCTEVCELIDMIKEERNTFRRYYWELLANLSENIQFPEEDKPIFEWTPEEIKTCKDSISQEHLTVRKEFDDGMIQYDGLLNYSDKKYGELRRKGMMK
jgi:hypothetical protein